MSIGWEGVSFVMIIEFYGFLFFFVNGYVDFVRRKVLFRVFGVFGFFLIFVYGYVEVRGEVVLFVVFRYWRIFVDI